LAAGALLTDNERDADALLEEAWGLMDDATTDATICLRLQAISSLLSGDLPSARDLTIRTIKSNLGGSERLVPDSIELAAICDIAAGETSRGTLLMQSAEGVRSAREAGKPGWLDALYQMIAERLDINLDSGDPAPTRLTAVEAIDLVLR
jgi:hypothetical protein